MRTVFQPLLFFAAICAIAPAAAELYKWVDERGVTNYANDPPPAAAIANKLTRVENKISVYTPDESFMQSVKALRERNLRALSAPAPQRSPVARIAAPPPSGYAQCLSSGRPDCDDSNRSYYPIYLPRVAGLPAHGVQPTRFLTPRPPASPAGGTRVRGSPAAR